jgi:peptidase M15-like protein
MSLLLALIAAQAAAQPAPQQPMTMPMQMPMRQGCCGMPSTVPPTTWNPAADYISVGQDEPGYRSWYLAAPWRAAQVKAFNDFLVTNQVGGIFPTWQLLRTATSWQECGGQPFEVPPSDQWSHMVQTLRYVRDYVIPAVGPVEAVSVYRNPTLNQCAGGAPESAHKEDSAIDMVPLRPIDRITLMRILCGIHSEHGAAYNAGLGFYAFIRFHVDSTKYRRWNMDPAVAAECPPIIHPEDIASVGQPLPASGASTAVPATTPPAPAPPANTATQPAAAPVVKTPERG